MLRFDLDEDAARQSLISGLLAVGIDARSTADERMRGLTDEQQLAFATSAGRSIVSHNVGDFLQIHSACMREGRSHAGIVVRDVERRHPVRRLRSTLREDAGPARTYLCLTPAGSSADDTGGSEDN